MNTNQTQYTRRPGGISDTLADDFYSDDQGPEQEAPARRPGGISDALDNDYPTTLDDEQGPEEEAAAPTAPTIACTFSRRNLSDTEAQVFAAMLKAHLQALYTGAAVEIETTQSVAWAATVDGQHNHEVLTRAAAFYLHPLIADVFSRISGMYSNHLATKVLRDMAQRRNAHPILRRAFA